MPPSVVRVVYASPLIAPSITSCGIVSTRLASVGSVVRSRSPSVLQMRNCASVTLEAKFASSRRPVSEPLSMYEETMCETMVALLCICSLRSSTA